MGVKHTTSSGSGPKPHPLVDHHNRIECPSWGYAPITAHIANTNNFYPTHKNLVEQSPDSFGSKIASLHHLTVLVNCQLIAPDSFGTLSAHST